MMIVMMIMGEETQAALPKPADSTRSGSGGNGKTRTAMHRADWVGKRGKFKKVKNRHDENYRFTWPVLLRRKLSYCSHDCMYISCVILLLFPMQPCTRCLSLLPVQIRPSIIYWNALTLARFVKQWPGRPYVGISVDYSYHHFHRVWAALYGVLLFPESKKVPLHVTLKLETKRGKKERKKKW